MKTPIKVLFLCTGNSCRSIIAEALANKLGGDKLRGLSAGSHPTGAVNPKALAVLADHGVPAGRPASKSMDDVAGHEIDLVVTVCDSAAGESCPVWLDDTPRVHWGVADPAEVAGLESRMQAAFETTYREMEARVTALAELDIAALEPPELVAAARQIHAEAD